MGAALMSWTGKGPSLAGHLSHKALGNCWHILCLTCDGLSVAGVPVELTVTYTVTQELIA